LVKNKKKIVFIVSSYEIGGAERNALQLVNRLKIDFEIIVICNGGFLASEFKKIGVFVKCIPLRDNLDIFGLTRLILFLKKIHPDILHLHMNRACLLGGIAGKILKIPTIAAVQSFTRLLYARFSDEITVCSPGMKEYFIDLGINEKKINIVYNPVFPDISIKVNTVPKFKNTQNIIVLFVGRLHSKKGVAQIPYFAERAREDHLNIEFHLVGDGSEKKKIISLIKKNGLEDKVILHGMIEDVKPFLSGADILILPSESEGLPLSLSEGLFFSRPFVAYNAGDTKILADSGGGIVIDINDKEAFYKTIKRLYKDAELRQSMGKLGRKLIDERFQINKVIDQIKNIYSSM